VFSVPFLSFSAIIFIFKKISWEKNMKIIMAEKVRKGRKNKNEINDDER